MAKHRQPPHQGVTNKKRNSANKNYVSSSSSLDIQPCFSGASVAIFLITFICINVVVFIMEGPFLYLNIIYSLYMFIIAAFVLQIILDLGIWEFTKSGNPRIRSFLSKLCPILCICMSLPPVALLWHTKNRGGFTSETSDISLIFSILIVAVEVFHFAVTVFIYKNFTKNSSEDSAVRFSYYSENGHSAGPSPASSIRSSRIDFMMNRSRNSLASIDSGFMNTNFASTRRVQRDSAMDVSARFWSEQNQQHQIPYLDLEDNHRHQPSQNGQQDVSNTRKDRGEEYDDDTLERRRKLRRDSDSSLVSGASFSSRKYSDTGSYSHNDGVPQRNSRGSRKGTPPASKDDFDLMDTQSIKSSGSNRSRSRRKRDYPGYRVEEEMDYQPGFFHPSYM